jgi:hypothetical protein
MTGADLFLEVNETAGMVMVPSAPVDGGGAGGIGWAHRVSSSSTLLPATPVGTCAGLGLG